MLSRVKSHKTEWKKMMLTEAFPQSVWPDCFFSYDESLGEDATSDSVVNIVNLLKLLLQPSSVINYFLHIAAKSMKFRDQTVEKRTNRRLYIQSF